MPNHAKASNLPLYNIFALQKVPLLKISDDVIACDLWFGLSQSKFAAKPTSLDAMFSLVIIDAVNF